MFDVIGQNGSQTYLKTPILSSEDSTEMIRAVFEIPKPVQDVEFRLLIQNQVYGQFIQYTLEKLDKESK
jgi:hypothetical protein